MILVVASQVDLSAERLVGRWASHGASLLTPRDLCTEGMQLELGDVMAGKVVAGGNVHDVASVRGVVSMLPLVNEQELVGFDASDRRYVATEMTSFLLYFLSALRCPVLGRPTPASLVGPGWYVEQWISACRRVGFAVSLEESAPSCARKLTLVGDSVVGDCDSRIMTQVLELGVLAKGNFFELSVTGPRDAPVVYGAASSADADDEHVLAAMLSFIAGTA
jgi:hypothetical protein